MKRKSLAALVALAASTVPMAFAASAPADNDGVPECNGPFELAGPFTPGAATADRNNNGFVCLGIKNNRSHDDQ